MKIQNPFLDGREFGSGINPNQAYETFLKSQNQRPSQKVENDSGVPSSKTEGLVIASGLDLMVIDFNTRNIKDLKRFNFIVTALAYWNGDLWIAQLDYRIGTLQDPKKIRRGGKVNTFFTYKDSLFEASEFYGPSSIYGIFETPSRAPHITPNDFVKMKIYYGFKDVFSHDGKLLALLSSRQDPILFELQDVEGKLALKAYHAPFKVPFGLERILSVHGRMVMVSASNYLIVDGEPEGSTFIMGAGRYSAIAFDPSREELYAATNRDKTIKFFKVEEDREKAKLILKPQGNLVQEVSEINVILPVTGTQLEDIVKKAGAPGLYNL